MEAPRVIAQFVLMRTKAGSCVVLNEFNDCTANITE